MTAVLKCKDGAQFPLTPEETHNWVKAYGARLMFSNGSQSQYQPIEPSTATLIVNVHSEAQQFAIESGNRRYQEEQIKAR